MQVTITSDGIIALCATFTALSASGLWVVKAIVAGEIRKLNGRYVYSSGSELTGHEIETRLDSAEESIKRLLAARHIG